MFIHADQRERFPGCRRTAGTADTVHVVFRHVWQLVVHHVRQLFNVQATGGDVGCHQHTYVAGFKISQRAGTRTLTLVAVDRRAANTVFIELFRQVVSAVLGAGKDQYLLPVALADYLGEQFPLALLIHKVHVLRHLLGGGIAARDFHFQRVMQQLFRQCLDLVGESRGEEQVLTTRRQLRQHAANVVDEAHIQHTVGFVQHQNFDVIELHRVLVFQIQQTPRRCHQHVHAAAQLHHLWVNAYPAENHQRTNVEVAAVFTHVLANLGRQFAGWGEDQRTHRTTAFGVRLVFYQQLQQRQGKARGLTGTGLRACHQVTALQNGRNGLLLDRGWLNVALLCDGAQNFRVQTKGIKRHKNSEPPRPSQV